MTPARNPCKIHIPKILQLMQKTVYLALCFSVSCFFKPPFCIVLKVILPLILHMYRKTQKDCSLRRESKRLAAVAKIERDHGPFVTSFWPKQRKSLINLMFIWFKRTYRTNKSNPKKTPVYCPLWPGSTRQKSQCFPRLHSANSLTVINPTVCER